MGQRSRSNAQNRVFTWLLPCFKVKVKVRGQGQKSGSRSNFWHAAVDNRGSALPSAAKSNKSHYQYKVFVCVSVIIGRVRIIARMRSIGVLIKYGGIMGFTLKIETIPEYLENHIFSFYFAGIPEATRT